MNRCHNNQTEDSGSRNAKESVDLPVEDHIDLHFFSPDDIPGVVLAYLEAAKKKGFTEVRIIHGRGKGVQRERVCRVLAKSKQVQYFEAAPSDRGGWGATVVMLHP